MEVQVKFGLCNRLQTIIGFFTYNNSEELKIVWKEDNECPGNFEDYFEKIPKVSFLKEKTENCVGNFFEFPYKEYALKEEEYVSKFKENHQIIVPNADIRKYIECFYIHFAK